MLRFINVRLGALMLCFICSN